jgi:hypothetical protein
MQFTLQTRVTHLGPKLVAVNTTNEDVLTVFAPFNLGFFIVIYLQGRTIALGSTQPLRRMSIRNISCRLKAVGA